MVIPADAAFEDVVRHLFDHPYTDPAWHWDGDADYWNASPAREAEVLTRLFRDAGALLAPYSDDQVGQGLWYVASASDHAVCTVETAVPLPARLDLVASIADLYRLVYAPRLGDELGHLGEGGVLSTSCYMWWDVFPWYMQPEDPARRELDARMLETLAEVLALDSAPCQEAALHGLSHSDVVPPPEAQAIVDRYVASGRIARPELRRYAKLARIGRVQ
jgi:hypothetical protein